MADQFTVDHDGYAEVNGHLANHVSLMDQHMEELNMTLRDMHLAHEGKATPLWQDHQHNWNSSYQSMKLKLSGHAQSSMRIGDSFREGDDTTGRIMS